LALYLLQAAMPFPTQADELQTTLNAYNSDRVAQRPAYACSQSQLGSATPGGTVRPAPIRIGQVTRLTIEAHGQYDGIGADVIAVERSIDQANSRPARSIGAGRIAEAGTQNCLRRIAGRDVVKLHHAQTPLSLETKRDAFSHKGAHLSADRCQIHDLIDDSRDR